MYITSISFFCIKKCKSIFPKGRVVSPMAEVPSRPCGGDFPGFNMFQWEKWWENMGENRENMGKMVNILAKW
jgi:hypothetical protein